MVNSRMADEDREVEKRTTFEDKQIQTLDIQSIQYEGYKCELQMPDIMRLIQADLSGKINQSIK